MPTPSNISNGKTDDVNNEDVLDGNTQDNKTQEVANDSGKEVVNDSGNVDDVNVLAEYTRDAEDAQQGEYIYIKLFIYVYKKLYKLNLLTNIHSRPNNADIAKKGENSNKGKCECHLSGDGMGNYSKSCDYCLPCDAADIEMPESTEKREECNTGKKSDNNSAHHSGECQNMYAL